MTPKQLERMAKAKGLACKVSSPVGMARLPQNSNGPQVLTDSPVRWAIEFSLPCKVISEANQSNREHWTKKMRRSHQQRESLHVALQSIRLLALPPGPYLVTWTRIGVKMLDEADNLPRAFKALTDHLAAWMGLDDGDPGIKFEYQQRLGPPGVEVRIESA